MATRPSSTVAKAFRVLELFRHYPVLTAALCTEELGIPRPTAHRLLISLREMGVVETTAHGHYRLSLLLFELGSLAPLRRRLSDQARAGLEKLADEVGFRVHLAVRQDVHLLYLETVHGRQGRPVPTRVGHRGPIHATGLGKLLLAYAPDDVVQRVVAVGLQRFTPTTLHTREAIYRELAQIRREGVAYDNEECLPGLCCIAAPIRDHSREVIAAVSVSANTSAMRARRTALRAQLLETIRVIEQGLVWESSLAEVVARARGPEESHRDCDRYQLAGACRRCADVGWCALSRARRLAL